MNWKLFSTFQDYQVRLWEVAMEGDDWKQVTCFCPPFLKEYICKHIIGISIKLGLYTVRDDAKDLPLTQKPKRGRPT